MTTYRVVFTAEAEGDLAVIYEHIATSSGEDRARSVVASLVQTCKSLDLFPRRGRPRDDLLPGLRMTVHRDWASIAFTIQGSVVTIQGVLWRGRDAFAIVDRIR